MKKRERKGKGSNCITLSLATVDNEITIRVSLCDMSNKEGLTICYQSQPLVSATNRSYVRRQKFTKHLYFLGYASRTNEGFPLLNHSQKLRSPPPPAVALPLISSSMIISVLSSDKDFLT